MRFKFFINMLFIAFYSNGQKEQFPLELGIQIMNQGPIPFQKNGVLDGVVVEENIPTKKVLPYHHKREADMVWSQRVWRRIDLREKLNYSLYYPMQPTSNQISLFDVIRSNAYLDEPALTLYDVTDPNNIYSQDGEQFKYPIERNSTETFESDTQFHLKVRDVLFHKGEDPTIAYQVVKDQQTGATGDSLDVNGKLVYPPTQYDPIESKDIVSYLIKEDWFLDKQTGIMHAEIIGIAPCRYYYKSLKREEVIGIKPMFWLYYPECRFVFQNYHKHNRQNKVQRMSYDDLFQKRYFGSTVYKVSNIQNRGIKEYESGRDALIEAQRLKTRKENIEQDLWNY